MSLFFIGATYGTTAVVAVAATASLVGTGIAIYGQQQAADAAEKTAAFNAQQSRVSAKQAQDAAAENARRKEGDIKRQLAAQAAALAGNGLAMTGTPLEVLGDTATDLYLEIQDLEYEARNRSRTLMANAAIGMREGQNTANSLRTQSYATGLQGVSSAATGYGKATGYLG